MRGGSALLYSDDKNGIPENTYCAVQYLRTKVCDIDTKSVRVLVHVRCTHCVGMIVVSCVRVLPEIDISGNMILHPYVYT